MGYCNERFGKTWFNKKLVLMYENKIVELLIVSFLELTKRSS